MKLATPKSAETSKPEEIKETSTEPVNKKLDCSGTRYDEKCNEALQGSHKTTVG